MSQPYINILIRTHRPELLKNCLASVIAQTFNNYKIHTHVDAGNTKPYDYNLYCNVLKEQVTDGWFMFLDDDDRFHNPFVLERIAVHLTEPDQPVICQYLRNGRAKPADKYMDSGDVVAGHIGMPCLFLPSKHKDMHTVDNTELADYNWIKHVSNILPCKFIKQVVVDAGQRRFGK